MLKIKIHRGTDMIGGSILVCSSTNVESLASFCNAARRNGRPFIVNHYVYDQIRAYRKSTGNEDDRLKFLKTYKFERRNRHHDEST